MVDITPIMLPNFDPTLVPADQIPATIAIIGGWLTQLAARQMTPAAPNPAASSSSLLTAVQVAEKLGLHESAVRTMERQGQIPGVRIGRYVRFRADEVEAALKALTKLSA